MASYLRPETIVPQFETPHVADWRGMGLIIDHDFSCELSFLLWPLEYQ